MHYDADVLVVGAGPAGSVAARDIARHGFKVLLLEEHARVGSPVHCSGLVTPRTLEAAGVAERDVAVNRIRGAIVHSPLGRQVVVGGDRVRALVIDRRRFDERLAEQAQEAGATLLLDRRVSGLRISARAVEVVTEGSGATRALTAGMVIGADGAMSAVARSLGLAGQRETVVAIGGEVAASSLEPDLVEVFVEPELTRGWFGWLIPTGTAGVSRIGAGLGQRGSSPRRVLEPMMGRHAHLKGRTFLRLQGGLIPIAPPGRIVADRAMLVGDAAGGAKPTSGGGIYTGVLSARMAASAAVHALSQEVHSAEALQPYEVAWATRVRRELLLGQALRRLLMRLTPGQIDEMLGLLELPEFRKLVLANGDIDFPARLFSRLLCSRVVLRSLFALRPGAWAALLALAWRWRQVRAGLAQDDDAGAIPALHSRRAAGPG